MHPHLRLSLMEQSKPVWRIISVPDTMLATQLSHVINLCFGWPDTKVYEFEVSQPAARFTDNMRHNLSGIKESHPLTNVTVTDLLLEQDSLVYHYGTNPSLKISVTMDSFPRIQHQPMLQLIDAFGDNIPSQDGSCIPYHKQTVTWQLQALQTKLVAKFEEEYPTDFFQLQKKLLEDGLLDDLLKEFKGEFSEADVTDIMLDIILDGIGDQLGQTLSKTYTLHQCLITQSKEELTNIAHFHKLSGFSKLRKTELLKFIETELQKPGVLERCFSKLTYPEIEQLDYLYSFNIPIIDYDTILSMQYLLAAGICYFNETNTAFTLPVEFHNAFLNMLESEQWQETVYCNDVVHTTCFTAVYLYGVYPVAALLEEVRAILGSDLDLNTLINIVKTLTERRKEYSYHSGFLIDVTLADDKLFHSLHQLQQQTNDYFWPDEEALNQIYWEKWLINQPLYDSFQVAYEKYYIGKENDFSFLLRQLEFMIRSGVPFTTIVQHLTEEQFALPNKKILKQFTEALQQIWNHTPMWSNNGYTPKQITQKQNQNKNVVTLADYKKK